MITTELKEPVLQTPYGGALIDLIAGPDELEELAASMKTLPAVQLSERSLCDLMLLATGAFSPLDRFMDQADHQRVSQEMRLQSGHVFPIPVTLPVENNVTLREGKQIVLCNSRNERVAVMTIEEVYEWDRDETARQVFGTQDLRHPLVAEMNRWERFNVSGPMRVLQLPRFHDFAELRLSPSETRARLESLGRPNVVAFQTRNPLHRVHEEITKHAIEEKVATLLLHPAVGMTQPGDVDHFSRVRTYKILAERYYDPKRILLSLLPLAMRLAGPREALWHALIRRNYGANFLIVGRDHASPGVDSTGKPFYPPYAAQELVQQFSSELGVGVVPFQELVYLPTKKKYVEVSEVPPGEQTLSISGTQLRGDYLEKGIALPSWFSRPEMSDVLLQTYPPRHQQGVNIWLTGLSCAGKSTIAEILTNLLLEHGRRITLLDGDIVRTHLSKGLGFSKEDRDLNIRRIGFVASEIVRHGGIAMCAAVSPYRSTRNEVRTMVGKDRFLEVFVDTPIDVCEQRDTKGMYAAARRGELRNFTGVDDPYEPPQHPEIKLDAAWTTPEDNARIILDYLIEKGFVQPSSNAEVSESGGTQDG